MKPTPQADSARQPAIKLSDLLPPAPTAIKGAGQRARVIFGMVPPPRSGKPTSNPR
jgi:hypothetical protein